MKWKYTGERANLFGRWCYPGDIVKNDTKPPGDWIQFGKEEITINETIGQVKESNGVNKLKQELMKKKMNELRLIGYEYGAKDTKKSELVQEIINAKIDRGEI